MARRHLEGDGRRARLGIVVPSVNTVMEPWAQRTVPQGVSVLAAMIGFGIPRIISAMPPQLINLPNKQYWLSLERLAETQAFLSNYFAWFGCAVFVVIIVTFDYAIQSNLHPNNRPDISRMWYILAGFSAFILVWIARMFTHFGRPPEQGSASAK